MTKIKHTAKIHFQRGNKSERKLVPGPKPTASFGRVPRIARLLSRFAEITRHLCVGVC